MPDGGLTRLRAVIALAVAAVMLAGAPARAQDKDPNTGRIALSAGVDFPTAYYFRGILQEDEDYIVQPYGDVTFTLYEGKEVLNAVTFTLGTWNSLHGGPTGVEDSANQDPKMWYESDFYAKVGTTLVEDLTAELIYTAYMSPNGRFTTVQELALGLSYNDAKLLGPFALNPSAVLAFEVKGQADAGRHRGVYLQLGVEPGVTLLEEGPIPVSFSLPLAVALSLSDYYEFGSGDDETFGYFSGGVTGSIPIAFLPKSLGAWTIKAGVNVLVLGDNLRAVNERDRTEVVGTIGIALTY